jgi:hypothetical protein
MFDVHDERLAIRCDTEMREQIAQLARDEDRPMSSMTRVLLRLGMDVVHAERANQREDTRRG